MKQAKSPNEYLEKLRKTEDIHVIYKSPEDIRRIYGDNPDAQYLIDLAKEKRDISYPQRLFDDIITGLPAQERARVRNEIAFGELLFRSVNATVRKAEDGYNGYVIVINRGLTSTFFHFTKAILARTATIKDSYLERAYNLKALSPCCGDYQVVADLIIDTLRRYHEGEFPEPPLKQRQLLLDEPRRRLLSALHENSVSFVISHELGHFFCGHMDQPPSKEHEFEADFAAMSVLLNKAYKLDDDRMIAMAIAGSLLALVYIEMIEKTGDIRCPFHPSAQKRIDKIRETFKFNSYYFEMADPLVKLARDICGRFER
jgi:hypothetical protein